MLAYNFKTAKQLGISEKRRTTLIRLLHMFDRGEILAENFDMGEVWCGTAGCIYGWARHIDPDFVDDEILYSPMSRLFYSAVKGVLDGPTTPEEGAAALRNYLTTGHAHWREIVRERKDK